MEIFCKKIKNLEQVNLILQKLSHCAKDSELDRIEKLLKTQNIRLETIKKVQQQIENEAKSVPEVDKYQQELFKGIKRRLASKTPMEATNLLAYHLDEVENQFKSQSFAILHRYNINYVDYQKMIQEQHQMNDQKIEMVRQFLENDCSYHFNQLPGEKLFPGQHSFTNLVKKTTGAK